MKTSIKIDVCALSMRVSTFGDDTLDIELHMEPANVARLHTQLQKQLSELYPEWKRYNEKHQQY